jgi:hypothetical protein
MLLNTLIYVSNTWLYAFFSAYINPDYGSLIYAHSVVYDYSIPKCFTFKLTVLLNVAFSLSNSFFDCNLGDLKKSELDTPDKQNES